MRKSGEMSNHNQINVQCMKQRKGKGKRKGQGNGNGNEKGKRLWKKVKYQLVEYHSLPGYLRDNEYIKGHYRANWPLKQAFFSIFTLHNETLNVWTHLIGFFFFLCLTIYTAKKVPEVVDLHSIQHLPDVIRRADLHKMHADILTCLPSLPDMSDLHKLPEELNSDKDLITGVCFGSAGSGFDDLTSKTTKAIPMSKQVEYFKKYIERVTRIVGEKRAKEIIRKAIVVINSGINDFVINYYDLPTKRLQYDINEYQDFVLQRLQSFVEEVHELGCRTIIVTGLPPIGCLPIQMTARFKLPNERKCLEDQNSDAMLYNQKLKKLIPHAQASLPGTRILYADVYTPFSDLVKNPEENGFKVTDRGCCGTGYIETGSLCNILTPTCKNATEFVFWDSAHPTEAAYQYVHDSLLEELGPQIINDPKFSVS